MSKRDDSRKDQSASRQKSRNPPGQDEGEDPEGRKDPGNPAPPRPTALPKPGTQKSRGTTEPAKTRDVSKLDPIPVYPEEDDLEEEWPERRVVVVTRSGLVLALSWVATAGCALLLWISHKSAHPPIAPQEARVAALSETAAGLQTKVAELEATIAELQGIRELEALANKAIANGDRSALYQLDEYSGNPEIPALRESAEAQIIRVETYFVTTRRLRGFEGEMPTIPESDRVGELSRILLDGGRPWDMRAQAARILSAMDRNVEAADALAKASKTDSSLYVVQESILAFSKITGYRSTGVFDGQSLNDWWADHRPDFE